MYTFIHFWQNLSFNNQLALLIIIGAYATCSIAGRFSYTIAGLVYKNDDYESIRWDYWHFARFTTLPFCTFFLLFISFWASPRQDIEQTRSKVTAEQTMINFAINSKSQKEQARLDKWKDEDRQNYEQLKRILQNERNELKHSLEILLKEFMHEVHNENKTRTIDVCLHDDLFEIQNQDIELESNIPSYEDKKETSFKLAQAIVKTEIERIDVKTMAVLKLLLIDQDAIIRDKRYPYTPKTFKAVFEKEVLDYLQEKSQKEKLLALQELTSWLAIQKTQFKLYPASNLHETHLEANHYKSLISLMNSLKISLQNQFTILHPIDGIQYLSKGKINFNFEDVRSETLAIMTNLDSYKTALSRSAQYNCLKFIIDNLKPDPSKLKVLYDFFIQTSADNKFNFIGPLKKDWKGRVISEDYQTMSELMTTLTSFLFRKKILTLDHFKEDLKKANAFTLTALLDASFTTFKMTNTRLKSIILSYTYTELESFKILKKKQLDLILENGKDFIELAKSNALSNDTKLAIGSYSFLENQLPIKERLVQRELFLENQSPEVKMHVLAQLSYKAQIKFIQNLSSQKLLALFKHIKEEDEISLFFTEFKRRNIPINPEKYLFRDEKAYHLGKEQLLDASELHKNLPLLLAMLEEDPWNSLDLEDKISSISLYKNEELERYTQHATGRFKEKLNAIIAYGKNPRNKGYSELHSSFSLIPPNKLPSFINEHFMQRTFYTSRLSGKWNDTSQYTFIQSSLAKRHLGPYHITKLHKNPTTTLTIRSKFYCNNDLNFDPKKGHHVKLVYFELKDNEINMDYIVDQSVKKDSQ